MRVKTPNDFVATPLETAKISAKGEQRGGSQLPFNWSHTVRLQGGGLQAQKLAKAIQQSRGRPGAADIVFVVVNASNGMELGHATVSLADLTNTAVREEPQKRLQVSKAGAHSGTSIGQLHVVVQAQEAVLQTMKEAPADDPVRKAFARFDKDGSGEIDEHELHDCLRELGFEATSAQARQPPAASTESFSR